MIKKKYMYSNFTFNFDCTGLKFGFAFVEAGKTDPKNVSNVIFKNVADTCKLTFFGSFFA